jgi:hypothetical protein
LNELKNIQDQIKQGINVIKKASLKPMDMPESSNQNEFAKECE